MTDFATIIDLQTLGNVVLYSLISGVGLSATFGIAVSAVAGISDARRRHRTAASAAYAAIATVTIAVSIAALVFGIILMTRKS